MTGVPGERTRADQDNYTIRAAAERLGRTPRTIERWIEKGMKHHFSQGIIVIDHPDLIAEMIKHNRTNPTMRGNFDTRHHT